MADPIPEPPVPSDTPPPPEPDKVHIDEKRNTRTEIYENAEVA